LASSLVLLAKVGDINRQVNKQISNRHRVW